MFECFFFQAEDGIRDTSVTGVQTCALPIYLLEEGGLELAEGSLDLALSLGIPGGAGTEGEAVGGCKLERLGDEAEGLAPGHPEGPHAVRPPDPRHAAGVLEEAHQALEGVGPVHRRGEPPVAVAAPAQDRPEAVQLPKA